MDPIMAPGEAPGKLLGGKLVQRLLSSLFDRRYCGNGDDDEIDGCGATDKDVNDDSDDNEDNDKLLWWWRCSQGYVVGDDK